MLSPYYDENFDSSVGDGAHRDAIGGLWDEVGELQFSFLQSQGLQAHHRVMDVGCGSLRLGCRLVDYVDVGHYYGIDLSAALLDAGYAKELSDAQRKRLPRSNLHATDAFDVSYVGGVRMDVAVAQSVFTHLPLNHLRDCLMKLHPIMNENGVFYVSFFHCPDGQTISEPITHPHAAQLEHGVTSYAHQDPYHYWLQDLEYAAKDTPWTLRLIGDWGHPRNQQMAAFELNRA